MQRSETRDKRKRRECAASRQRLLEHKLVRASHFFSLSSFLCLSVQEEVELHTARNAWLQQVATLQTEYQTALEAVRAQQESMQAAADAAIAAMAGGPGMTLEAEQISLPEPPAPVLPAPPAVDISRLTRNILADKPRVTRFQIPWDQEQNVQEVRKNDDNSSSRAKQKRQRVGVLHARRMHNERVATSPRANCS